MLFLLRQSAPHLTKRFFTCPQSRAKISTFRQSRATHSLTDQTAGIYNLTKRPSSICRGFHHTGFATAPDRFRSTQFRALSSGSTTASSKSYFPEENAKSAGYWLLASAASVFGLVVFGGLTRLTESGYISPSCRQDWSVADHLIA